MYIYIYTQRNDVIDVGFVLAPEAVVTKRNRVIL